MQHNLLGKGLTITPEIRDFVDRKLSGLEKLVKDPAAVRADVELEYLESEEKTYRAELMIHDHTILRSEARGKALHEAFDKAAGELHIELSRAKKKRLRLLRHGASRIKEYLRGFRSKP